LRNERQKYPKISFSTFRLNLTRPLLLQFCWRGKEGGGPWVDFESPPIKCVMLDDCVSEELTGGGPPFPGGGMEPTGTRDASLLRLLSRWFGGVRCRLLFRMCGCWCWPSSEGPLPLWWWCEWCWPPPPPWWRGIGDPFPLLCVEDFSNRELCIIWPLDSLFEEKSICPFGELSAPDMSLLEEAML
jgi:hypothetical protein